MELIIIISYYIAILISIIGFGYIASKILRIDIVSKDVMLFGILGIIFLTFLSYLTNLFTSHNILHNSILHLIGISLFIYGYSKLDIDRKSLFKILLLAVLLLIFSLMAKSHDDFGWYHLPYMINLSEHKFQYGLGHFNHGFRTPSSLFYLNSLFYLPIVKFYSFNFAQLYIFLFSLIFFYKKTMNRFNNNTLTFFYSLLTFIFVIVVFYRLAEHGSDRSGQILVFIAIILIFEILKNSKIKVERIHLLILILIYTITIKTYFIVYILLLLPILFKIKINAKVYTDIIFSRLILFSIIFLLMHFNIQVANSGCLLYPINFTCYSGFIWSIGKDEITLMSQWYELWAKSGANPNFRVDDPEQYINNLHWVSRWFSNYFLNKISDLILGIVLILIISFYLFKNKSKKKINTFKTNNLMISFTFSIMVIFLIWFIKFPQLRYGGYTLIANLFFLPFCFYVTNYQINKKAYQSAKILFTISIIVFLGRNINRVSNEITMYQYNPIKNAYFHIQKPQFERKTLNNGIVLNLTKGECWSIPQPCARSPVLTAIKKNGYVIYYRK
jgi:hypothetical protein